MVTVSYSFQWIISMSETIKYEQACKKEQKDQKKLALMDILYLLL